MAGFNEKSGILFSPHYANAAQLNSIMPSYITAICGIQMERGQIRPGKLAAIFTTFCQCPINSAEERK